MIKNYFLTVGLITITFYVLRLQNILYITLIFLIFTTVLVLNEKYRYRLKYLIFISLFIFFFHIFIVQQTLVEKVYSGIKASLSISILSMLAFIYSSLISMTKFSSMLFFLPAKIKLALNITFSQIPNILYEFEKITLVQKSKGFSPGIKKKYKILPVLFIPLIHRIIKRGENLTIIMISKAYE